MTDATEIKRIDAWEVRYPLETPFFLGRPVRERRYVISRVETRDGTEGLAYTTSHSAGVDIDICEALGPNLLGRDAMGITLPDESFIPSIWRAILPNQPEGPIQRALSLVDICLWDIAGKQKQLPVWKLLSDRMGGSQAPLPAQVLRLVDGYPLPQEAAEAFVRRLLLRAEEGYRQLKVAKIIGASDLANRFELIPPEAWEYLDIAVDLAWDFRSVNEAIDACALLDSFPLLWFEDPFVEADFHFLQEFRGSIATPIAVGDGVTRSDIMMDVISNKSVDVVRLDATAMGGFTGAIRLVEISRALGNERQFSTHIYPEIHRHCAFAMREVGELESFPRGGPFDYAHRFIADSSLDVTNDLRVEAPESPGLGLALNWSSVSRHAARHVYASV